MEEKRNNNIFDISLGLICALPGNVIRAATAFAKI